MSVDINKEVIKSILDSIPPNIKPVDFLIDNLGVSKESAYRRIRGDIAFSLEELSKLSLILDISIDRILGTGSSENVFFNILGNRNSPRETFYTTLNRYYDYILAIHRATDVEIILALNQVIYPLFIGYDHLFRFLYYKWLHQMGELSGNSLLSDFSVPKEIVDLCNKISYYKSLCVSQNTYIIEHNTFLNTINWVQYYYKRKLINEEELHLLKEDFLNIFLKMEKNSRPDIDKNKSVNYFFLSAFNIESNSVYTQYDDKMLSFIWASSSGPIRINNPEICLAHKKWLNSLKRFSILFTHSNEILLGKFLSEQRRYLDTMLSQ
jgi:hypothetical protein